MLSNKNKNIMAGTTNKIFNNINTAENVRQLLTEAETHKQKAYEV